MSRIREKGVKSSYAGMGSVILKEFLLPLLESATSYDRITSFFTVESLLAISQGLQSVWEHGGKVRIIMGIHSVPADLVKASDTQDVLREEIDRIRGEITSGLSNITDELARHRIATIAWMIQDGLLSVKAAATLGGGTFHPKTMIISDGKDTVAAIGSSNETGNGLGGNFEQIVSVKSWVDPEGVAEQESFFSSLWNNENPYAAVCDITGDIEQAVRDGLGKDSLSRESRATGMSGAVDVLGAARKMPSSFFYSGDIPCLFQHQERAVIDALSRWPVRVMFADEVGLGKTFETAATISFLVRYCGVRRVLVLTPKAVLWQWQDELFSHFGVDAWVYDSANRCYVSPRGMRRDVGRGPILGKVCPPISLISAQFARGGGGKKDIFAEEGAILPDLLVVDEAHAARVSASIDGSRKPTLLYKVLERIAAKIPHVIFATATPMQKDPLEYHAMLSILGLPKAWKKPEPYLRSLELISLSEMPMLDDGAVAARLLGATLVTMKPSLASFSSVERGAIAELLRMREEKVPSFEQANYVIGNWKHFQSIFVRLHPASILTIRNTRRSLEEIGYVFPKRSLHTVEMEDSAEQVIFSSHVNKYLDRDCFSTERELNPGSRLNMGFVRNQYMQRTASSLTSCLRTLERRLEKISAIRRAAVDGLLTSTVAMKQSSALLDDIDEDELLQMGAEPGGKVHELDLSRVECAASVEMLQLEGLVTQANRLLETGGDRKVAAAIDLALNHVAAGDRVLVFSRYTDTVDALIDEYADSTECIYPFGIYDGGRSQLVIDGVVEKVDKNEIKSALQEGRISIMFCSDAASEGLNLQSARVLINVDVPWTPSRLEQRIGRIARLGQKASSVEVYNIWYPTSIEALMYKRIQSRLDSLNLAIGEFPDVVAESIKNSVISNEDDHSFEELQQIRNSAQMTALERLWYSKREQVTESDQVRRSLLDLVASELGCSALGDGRYRVTLPNGSHELLTTDVGDGFTVSLASRAVKAIKRYRSDVDVGIGDSEMPAAFIRPGNPGKWAKTVDVLSSKEGSFDFQDAQACSPVLLPEMNRIDMSFALDITVSSAPQLWPPKGEKNEG